MSGKCKICAKDLPDGARKCTECGEFQSPAMRILAGLDLKGLIALVPIVTLAYAFIQDRIEGEFSRLDVALVSCTEDTVTAFVSNIGNKNGIITRATYTTAGSEPRAFELPEPSESRLFEGGESRIIELKVNRQISPGGLVPFDARQKPDCGVDIAIETLAFDHSTRARTLSCDCPS